MPEKIVPIKSIPSSENNKKSKYWVQRTERVRKSREHILKKRVSDILGLVVTLPYMSAGFAAPSTRNESKTQIRRAKEVRPYERFQYAFKKRICFAFVEQWLLFIIFNITVLVILLV